MLHPMGDLKHDLSLYSVLYEREIPLTWCLSVPLHFQTMVLLACCFVKKISIHADFYTIKKEKSMFRPSHNFLALVLWNAFLIFQFKEFFPALIQTITNVPLLIPWDQKIEFTISFPKQYSINKPEFFCSLSALAYLARELYKYSGNNFLKETLDRHPMCYGLFWSRYLCVFWAITPYCIGLLEIE